MVKPKTTSAGKTGKAIAAKSAAKSASTKVVPARSRPASGGGKSAPVVGATRTKPVVGKAKAPVAKGPAVRAAAGKAPATPVKAPPPKAPPARAAAAKAPVEPPKPVSLLPATGPVTETGMARKKKNVKRGAPPMLPRRMMRRPDPPMGGAGSPTPAPAAPTRPLAAAPPGSLHAPARVPEGAESLKQRLGTVMTLLNQLRVLRRGIQQRQFFEAGLVLRKLSDPPLFQAKGYGSFESFIEREVERELSIGRGLAHDLVLIVRLFQREAAEEIGLEKLRGALRAIDGTSTASAPPMPAAEVRHDDT